MKKLRDFFKKPWVLAVLGMLALCALIWYVGPLFAFAGWEPLASEVSRLLLMTGVVVTWLVYRLWRWFADQRANVAMLAGLAKAAGPGAATPSASAEEVERLRQRFDEALEVLRKARFERNYRRQYVYQLPWYVIIGAPGSGKTTAILNSGLTFPLGEQLGKSGIRGVGGTRDCDWFFTDEAVLLDTAGRYTTQDSQHEVDSAAWLEFLALLKKYRRRRPINGVLVALSVRDLIEQSEAERAADAHAIRQRIQELHSHFGIRFPIYVMLTKCDLLPGFMEFFGEYGKEERTQVWGVTFAAGTPDTMDAVLGKFGPEFGTLESRLNERLLHRLQVERDTDRRALIYGFPQQFHALKEVVLRHIAEIFQPSRYQERPWLRGFYFTSGTQEGTPIDRVMTSLARAFSVSQQALTPQTGAGKSYFVTRLLREVVFQEAGLAGTNLTFERQRHWLQGAGYAGLGGLLLCASVAWLTSYRNNLGYIDGVAKHVRGVQEQIVAASGRQSDLISVLPVLNAMRAVPGGYADRATGTPWRMGFGLYQGDKLGSESSAVYKRTLQGVFLPKLLFRLEEQLQTHAHDPEYLYEGLKAYLMLADASRFNAGFVKAWFRMDWDQQLPRDAADLRQALMGHLDALFEKGYVASGFNFDENLIRSARETLGRISLPERVYTRLKRSDRATSLSEFRISEAAGRDAPIVLTRRSGEPLTRGVSGLYTQKGYHQFVQSELSRLVERLADENWVYGDTAIPLTADQRLTLAESVRQLYFSDYIKRWDALLTDVEVVPLGNFDQAVRVLGLLAGTDSPYKKFLLGVQQETTLVVADKSSSNLVERAQEKLSSAQSQLEEILGRKISGSASGSLAKLPEQTVDDHFTDLHDFVKATEGGRGAPIDQVLALLNELSVYVNAVGSAAKRGESPASVPGREIIAKLKMEAPRAPGTVGVMLKGVADKSASLGTGSERERLNSLWRASVVPFYQLGISGRYPMIRGSRQEVTQEDFARFFGPGGLVDDFFQKNLRPFVDVTRPTWRWNVDEGGRLGLNSASLVEFQRAAQIRQTFFSTGGQAAGVRFQLKPLTMDPEISQFLLEVDGQTLTYTHGPLLPVGMQWPGGGEAPRRARVQVTPPAVSGRSGFSEDGPWAWFRLLDRARIETTQQVERFRVSFDIDGRKVSLELWASSVMNPFRMDALEKFRCPERL